MHRKYPKILGVKVDSTSTARVLRFVRSSLEKRNDKSKFLIVTPNPEQIMLAQDDPDFKKILNKADISLPDGIGLAAAYKFLRLPNPKDKITRFLTLIVQGLGVAFSILFDRAWLEKDIKTIKGREVFVELIKLANKKGWKVYILGGWDKVAERTKLNLEKGYKRVKIKAGTGPVLDDSGTPVNKTEEKVEKESVKEINNFAPQLLFVGFRAPVQEKWVHKWLGKLDVGGAMVLGGTFDYISGKFKLPPKFVAKLGLEWLWRLFIGKQKTSRVYRAFPEFPLRVFLHKLSS